MSLLHGGSNLKLKEYIGLTLAGTLTALSLNWIYPAKVTGKSIFETMPPQYQTFFKNPDTFINRNMRIQGYIKKIEERCRNIETKQIPNLNTPMLLFLRYQPKWVKGKIGSYLFSLDMKEGDVIDEAKIESFLKKEILDYSRELVKVLNQDGIKTGELEMLVEDITHE